MEKKQLLLLFGLVTGLLIFALLKSKQGINYLLMKVTDFKSEPLLKQLHNEVEGYARIAINELEKEFGITVRTYRTKTDENKQTKLYNQPWDGIDNDHDGLIDEPDEKVTNAEFFQTYHFYGLALDVVEIKPFYGFAKGYDKTRWKIIADVFKKYGFEWGGDWPDPDKPHMQMRFGNHWRDLYALYQTGKVDIKGNVLLA